jgi:microsomal dipeptidase-like Zn-dependent dipeptidase
MQTDWHHIHFEEAIVVDLHAHPSFNVSLFHRLLTARYYPSSRAFDPFSVRTSFPRLRQGGVDIVLSVLHAPERGIFDECRPLRLFRYLRPRVWRKIYGRPYFDVTQDMLLEMEKSVSSNLDARTGKPYARFAHSLKELDDLLSQGKERPLVMIHCVEGAHSLDGKLDNLQRLFEQGVAYLILAHFFENEVVYPCYPWPETLQRTGYFRGERDMTLGLKPFGEQVVEKMVEMGMLIDVSHCTPPARARIYDIVGNRAPLLASHVGAYEINPDPYNLQDWELRKIAQSGGVARVIFMNYWLMPHETGRGINFITRTLSHFVNVAGIDHVGLGSDFDGFTDPPDDLKDASELPRLTQRLVAEGYSPAEIGKFLGGNALRVLQDGWGR